MISFLYSTFFLDVPKALGKLESNRNMPYNKISTTEGGRWKSVESPFVFLRDQLVRDPFFLHQIEKR